MRQPATGRGQFTFRRRSDPADADCERVRLSLSGLLGATQLLGCASYGSHLAATPVPQGTSELSLNADGMIIDRGLGPQLLPNPEAALRYGLLRELDVGGRLNAGSLELDGRLRLVHTKAFALSVVPGVGGGFVPVTNADTGLCNANLLASVLGGFNLGGRDELTLGPRIISTYAFPLTLFQGDATGARFVHSVGGVLGARFAVGKRFALSPELNVFMPYDTERHEWYLPAVQGGLGFQFGSRPAVSRDAERDHQE